MARVVAPFQPTLFSPLYIFQRAAASDVVILMGSAQHTAKSPDLDGTKKLTGQRHCKVRGEVLSVPVAKEMRPIDDTPLGRSEWRGVFVQQLDALYGCEPYFGQWIGPVRDMLASSETLGQLNGGAFRLIHERLGLSSRVVQDHEACVKAAKSDWVLSMVQGVGGTALLTGAPSMTYMDRGAFEEAGVEIIVQDWTCPEPEAASLSVLHSLFRLGTEQTAALLR